MNHIFKASKLFSKLRNRSWIQHSPNSTTDGHNDDQPGIEGNVGIHPKSLGFKSDYDWSKHPYQYHWNSLGLRGPEPNPNATRKILAIGNSLVLGSGVPVEESFVYKTAKHFNADYINLSDNFVLTDVVDYTKDILEWYKPNIIYISDFRFIDVSSMLVWNLRKTYDIKDLTTGELLETLLESMIKTVNMFEDTIRLYAPNTKVIWDLNQIEGGGRTKNFSEIFTHPKIINALTFPYYTYTNKEILKDLGRDNKHPGIKGHEWMTQRLIKIIGDTLNGIW
jgi:hypothetical protein